MPSSELQKQQQQQQQTHVLFGTEYVPGELLSEYQTLQRQLKILEGDRRSLGLEAADAARRQQADLHRLERENAELRSGLSASRSRSAKRERQSEAGQLRELVAELESLEAEARRTREGHQQLDARIREARRRRQLTAAASGGGSAASGAERSLQESLVLHEKKLESRCVKYQTVVWENARLRESLDHLRADRHKFLAVRAGLQAELARGRARRGDLTASASEAFREREDAVRRIRELEEREKAAAAEHQQRVKLLYREIDFHDYVGAFVRAKSQARSPDPELQRLRADLEQRRLEDGQRQLADEQSLRQVFDTMRRRYAAASLDDMVRHYLLREDENFSLFRYCTSGQAEAAALGLEVERLASDIRRVSLEEVDLVAGRSELLSELAGRLAEAKADRLRRSERLRAVSGVLEALAERATLIAARVGVSDEEGLDEEQPPRRGLLRLLGSLEGRVLDLLAVRQFLLGADADAARRASRIGRRGTDAFAGLQLPDVDELDVDVRTAGDQLLSERPLTKGEIVEKLQNEIAI